MSLLILLILLISLSQTYPCERRMLVGPDAVGREVNDEDVEETRQSDEDHVEAVVST